MEQPLAADVRPILGAITAAGIEVAGAHDTVAEALRLAIKEEFDQYATGPIRRTLIPRTLTT